MNDQSNLWLSHATATLHVSIKKSTVLRGKNNVYICTNWQFWVKLSSLNFKNKYLRSRKILFSEGSSSISKTELIADRMLDGIYLKKQSAKIPVKFCLRSDQKK